MSTAAVLIEKLKVFSRLESNSFPGIDFHFRPGAGIASHAGLSRLDREDAEPTQLNALSFGHCLLHALKDHVHGCFRLGARQSSSLHNLLDEVLFDQEGSPSLYVRCGKSLAWTDVRPLSW